MNPDGAAARRVRRGHLAAGTLAVLAASLLGPGLGSAVAPSPAAAQEVDEARTAEEAAERLRSSLDEARSRARDVRAHRRAPRTFREAESLRARADSVLAEVLDERPDLPPGEPDRDALSAADAVADSAILAYGRAARLARLVDAARRDDDGERILLRYEEALERVAEALGVETAFDGAVTGADLLDEADEAAPGEADATERLERTVERLREGVAERDEQVARLRDSLARTSEELAELRDRADSLDARLQGALVELEPLNRYRERLEARERRISEVEALFSPGEAEIASSRDSMSLRLVGLTFETGSHEIPEDARPLLVKVQSAIRAFPDAKIRIAGHTDSIGDPDRNRVLSQRRAVAVREHLLTALPLSADRVTARGYGETRPIASNETEEGRALNRRVEVVLGLPRLELELPEDE